MRFIIIKITLLFFLGLGSATAFGQCFTPRWHVTFDTIAAPKNSTVLMPVNVDFSGCGDGLRIIDILFVYDDDVMDFAGIKNLEPSLVKVNTTLIEPGKLRLTWQSSRFSGIEPTILHGKMLDLELFYHEGEGVIDISEITVIDIWGNHFMGITTPGKIYETPAFRVNVVTNPPDIGAVLTGAGDYYPGEVVEISTDVPFNHRFKYWTNNFHTPGIPADFESLHSSFSMQEFPVTLTAHFDKIFADPVSLSLSFAGNGRVIINGETHTSAGGAKTLWMNRGSEVILEAIADENWVFERWDGVLQHSLQPTMLIVDEDVNLTAVFTRLSPAMVLTVEGSGVVYVEGQGYAQGVHPFTYEQAKTINLTQQAADGWQFSKWESDYFPTGASSSQSVSIQLVPGVTLVKAIFTQIPVSKFTLQIAKTGSGQVLVNGFPYTGVQQFDQGAQLSVEAIAENRWEFDGWSGSGVSSANQQINIVMDNNKELVATFVQTFSLALQTIPADVTAKAEGAGFYRAGTPVNINAELNDHLFFSGWEGSAENLALLSDPDGNTASLTMPARDVTLTASYIKLHRVTFLVDMKFADGLHHALTFHRDKDAVFLTGDLFSWKQPGAEPARLMMEAHQNDPTIFVVSMMLPAGEYNYLYIMSDGADHPEWNNQPERSFTVEDADVVVNDLFGSLSEPAAKYVIVAEAGSNGSVSPSGEIIVQQNESLTLVFTPDTGYHVDEVFINGKSIGSAGSFILTEITENYTVQVLFAINRYKISITSNEGGSLSHTGELTVEHGDDLLIDVVPNTGYHVKDIRIDGQSIGVAGNIPLSDISGNHQIHVVFAINMYSITVSHTGEGSVTPRRDISVAHGSDVRFTITPGAGYHLGEVQVDGEVVGQQSDYVLKSVTGNHHVHVVFVLTTYSVRFNINAASSGEEIADARITFAGVQRDAGLYRIEGLVPGKYAYQVTRDGYFSVSDEVTVADDDVTISLNLTIDNTSVKNIMVSELKAWPIPARDVLWVEFSNPGGGQAAVEFYDLQGRMVRQEHLSETGNVSTSLQVHDMQPGVYLLVIRANQQVASKQILIR